MRFFLDGEPLAGPMVFFISRRKGRNHVVHTGVITLGERRLEAGDRKLTIEIVGRNPEAKRKHGFGLDFMKLTASE